MQASDTRANAGAYLMSEHTINMNKYEDGELCPHCEQGILEKGKKPNEVWCPFCGWCN